MWSAYEIKQALTKLFPPALLTMLQRDSVAPIQKFKFLKKYRI